MAAAHKDMPMCLDEIGEANSRELGQAIYQLAGGMGKRRMSADATQREAKSWRIILLSTGEISIADALQHRTLSGGRQMKSAKRTSTDAGTKGWLISRPEGFYVRLYVAGLPGEEHGPFPTRAKASRHYAMAMDLLSGILVNLFNGDGETTYRMMYDTAGFIRENAPRLGMA
jgi:hypothetical protein